MTQVQLPRRFATVAEHGPRTGSFTHCCLQQPPASLYLPPIGLKPKNGRRRSTTRSEWSSCSFQPEHSGWGRGDEEIRPKCPSSPSGNHPKAVLHRQVRGHARGVGNRDGGEPVPFQRVRCPLESISWDDAIKFIEKLNAMEGSEKYRLPTEAEWE